MSDMAENNLGQLNAILFAEMRQLSSVDARDGDALANEVARAKAMTDVASSIIQGSNVVLKAARMRAEYSGTKVAVPRMLGE